MGVLYGPKSWSLYLPLKYIINTSLYPLFQYWMMSKGGEIRRDDGCLDYSGGESVIIYPCHSQKGNQEWVYREVGTLWQVSSLN